MCAGYAHGHRIHGCASTKAGQPIGNQLTHDRGESRPPPPPPRGHPSAPFRVCTAEIIDRWHGQGKHTSRIDLFSIDHRDLIFFFEIYPESSFSSLPPSQLCPHNRCRLLIAKRFALNCSRELVWNIGLREGEGGC